MENRQIRRQQRDRKRREIAHYSRDFYSEAAVRKFDEAFTLPRDEAGRKIQDFIQWSNAGIDRRWMDLRNLSLVCIFQMNGGTAVRVWREERGKCTFVAWAAWHQTASPPLRFSLSRCRIEQRLPNEFFSSSACPPSLPPRPRGLLPRSSSMFLPPPDLGSLPHALPPSLPRRRGKSSFPLERS